MPVPLDEYPIHQVPLSLEQMASSDRNAYDRSYFNAHDRTGRVFWISGMGYYPNLGVMDAYATVRIGDLQHSLRISDAISQDRLNQAVGPYRIEVIEPLQVIRLVCDAPDHGMSFDMTWTGSFPAVEEPRHIMRQGDKTILDACRFAQVGTWSGSLQVAGEDFTLTDDVWVGTRDRSWGIRPVGEAEPAGRTASEGDPDFGFWWLYVPMRFEDFGIVIIAQEDGDGHRTLNEAVRVFPEASGRKPEQIGWPRTEIRYAPGTRLPVGATLHCTEPDGTPLDIEVETLGFAGLNTGAGYGGDPDWGHGQWKGRNWIESGVVDHTDPAVAGRVPFSVVDHVATARIGDAVGYGLFEHGTLGRHLPSGFTDWGSVGE
jgi:hypothetical protein